jgi:CubicO group peptidase (beta-lactamase class C family)
MEKTVFQVWKPFHCHISHLGLLIVGIIMLGCSTSKNTAFGQGIDLKNRYKTAYYADNERFEKVKQTFAFVDSIYKNAAKVNNFPGLAFAVVLDGKMVYSGSYGYSDLENKVPVTTSTMFRIASMSKSFTAMAILHLRDQGKISLDDPVEKYMPELKNLKHLSADAPLITIRQCMTHNAGFPEDNPWGDRQLQDSDSDLLKLLSDTLYMSNVPGLAYEYSNLGFAILGRIITKVSGIQYQDYIKTNILSPLKMHATDWEFDHIDRKLLAKGYRWEDGMHKNEALLHDNPKGSWGAMGSMITSIDEFMAYMALHLSAWPPSFDHTDAPIKNASLREMHKPWNFGNFNPNFRYSDGRLCSTASAYGYGLRWMKDCDQKTYIGHSGGLPGFGSHWIIMPEYGIGVVALANRTYAGASAINMQVIDAIVMKAGLKPRVLPPSAILITRQKEIVGLMPDWKNAETSGIFAENFFSDYSLSSIQRHSNDLFTKAGKIVKIQTITPENHLRGTFIMECQNSNIGVYFTLTPENPPKIQELRMFEAPEK